MKEEIVKHRDCLCLSYDGQRFRWTANFETLKFFVDCIIDLKGKWSAPGGKARMFTCFESDTTLTWYPGKQNSLILHGKSSVGLRNQMIAICRLTNGALQDNNNNNKDRSQPLESSYVEDHSEETRSPSSRVSTESENEEAATIMESPPLEQLVCEK